MPKLSKKEKELKAQRRNERKSLRRRRRKKKLERLKNTGQMGRYYAQKHRAEQLRQLKAKPVFKIVKPEKLTLWKRIKEFFIILRKILRR